MTQVRHSLERLSLPDEQKIAAVVAGIADVGILRCLIGADHHGATYLTEQPGAIDDLVFSDKAWMKARANGELPPPPVSATGSNPPETRATRACFAAMQRR